MPKKMRSFIGVVPVVTLSLGDEILVHHNINKYIPSHKICFD